MLPFLYISGDFIGTQTNFAVLTDLLEEAFGSAGVVTPMRHHHDFDNPTEQVDSTLLLMPAWRPGQDLGVKIVAVSPNNSKYALPTIQGSYLYMDAHKGQLLAILDAKALTVKRTAAASALASRYLSRTDASSLLMIGTGALSSNLIQAHAAVRPIKHVYVWGRNLDKARSIANSFATAPYEVTAIETISDMISKVDIISTATLSDTALVLGEELRPGQHIDLVGSYKKTSREADDLTISRSTLYVDSMAGGLTESGDIIIPLEEGLISRHDVKADLFGMCSGQQFLRSSDSEITLFKSVGHALEDLVAAKYYYQQYTSMP